MYRSARGERNSRARGRRINKRKNGGWSTTGLVMQSDSRCGFVCTCAWQAARIFATVEYVYGGDLQTKCKVVGQKEASLGAMWLGMKLLLVSISLGGWEVALFCFFPLRIEIPSLLSSLRSSSNIPHEAEGHFSPASASTQVHLLTTLSDFTDANLDHRHHHHHQPHKAFHDAFLHRRYRARRAAGRCR